MTPTFDPLSYLSSLGQRHQTLEDLQADLRDRSQQLGKELLDLVNSHYEDFLTLGSNLKGGDAKVEELRAGVLGFKREAVSIRDTLLEEEQAIEKLIAEKKRVRKDIATGQRLVQWERRLSRLEEKLLVGNDGVRLNTQQENTQSSDMSSTDDDDGADPTAPSQQVSRIQRRVHELLVLERQTHNIDVDQPYLVAQGSRLTRVRNTLLLDIRMCLKDVDGTVNERQRNFLALAKMYRLLGATQEAVKAIKDFKPAP